MTSWQLVEAVVGFFLVVVASVVITRPTYRMSRLLLGMAAASWVVGMLAVVDGLAR